VPLRSSTALGFSDGIAAAKELRLVRDQAKHLVDRLPSQYEFLAQLHGTRQPDHA